MKKNISGNLYRLLLVFVSLLSAGGEAATSKTLLSEVIIDIPEPTCSVSAPDNVDLGVLTPGMNITWLPDVNVGVECNGKTIKHILYMTTRNTHSGQNDGILLRQTKDQSDTGILLQLEGIEGKKFTTDESRPESVASGTSTANYPIKVRVKVPVDAKGGEVGGTVVFKLHYS